jgi:hypothetical protein
MKNATTPRAVVIGFRVRPETARVIRQRAREDGRTVSRFVACYLEQTLIERATGERQ